ncbi:MAG: nitrate transporter [Sphingomonas bacterium]|nr:nitrate transporter [Sphingomonas bacterium]
MTNLSIAFLPLTDSAPLIVAREKGFAAEQGLDLNLLRESSWATVRDRLVYRQVQAAHMLAPLAVAVTLGLSQHPASLAAPFKLNVNGNALTLAHDFAAALDPNPLTRVADPVATAHDFAAAIGLHRRKPVIGVVHRFSSHALTLRYWLAFAGVDPDRDLTLRVLPPSLMVEALGSGEIDGFIAGEPWSSVAVAQNVGVIVAVGANIWQRGVEKVVATRTDWAEEHPVTVDALLRALDRAALWCDEPANRPELAALLSRRDYVGQPADQILPALTGRVPIAAGVEADVPNLLLFHREATNFPWRSQALWIYSQFVRWGMVEAGDAARDASAGVFRSDIYRRALGDRDVAMPGASLKLEGALTSPTAVGARGGRLTLGPDRFFDGRVFDPDAIAEYLANTPPQ